MIENATLVAIACPYCRSTNHFPWAKERGYVTVRCADCDLLYVNPAPAAVAVDEAVKTGFHSEEVGRLDVRSRRIPKKVAIYEALFGRLLEDVWAKGQPIHWVDVGSGYGEVLEAVQRLAPAGSIVEGFEPMAPKAELARSRGLRVINDYLDPSHGPVDFVSSIDVFSHIPDYRAFLADVASVLKPGGEAIVETGNLADVRERKDFPHELGLPDHLVFAGKKHIVGLLEDAGFEIRHLEEIRMDGFLNLGKNIAKALLGRPAGLGLPYASTYRQLVVRARRRG